MGRAGAAVALCVVLVACEGGGNDGRVVLDGRPRHPDVEGVVEEISTSHVRLRGGRRYKVTRKLQAFSTTTLEPVPVLRRRGHYVQLGVEGDTAVWLAAFGAVLELNPPVVPYVGFLEAIRGDRAVFRDGTVLRLAPGAARVEPNRHARAEIDPEKKQVRLLAPT